MTETRRRVASFTRRYAQVTSKKTPEIVLKIEVFSSILFATAWGPTSKLFYPKPPLSTAARIDYRETRYRVRVNNKWIKEKAKYHMFTKEQIFKRWLDF